MLQRGSINHLLIAAVEAEACADKAGTDWPKAWQDATYADIVKLRGAGCVGMGTLLGNAAFGGTLKCDSDLSKNAMFTGVLVPGVTGTLCEMCPKTCAALPQAGTCKCEARLSWVQFISASSRPATSHAC